MNEQTPQEQESRQQPKQLKGFYGKARVSVRVLDFLIIGGAVALIVVLAFAMQHRGFTVTFDTLGGTAVESQLKMYGDKLDPPAEPTREGYTFVGWAQDQNGQYMWDVANDQVSETMTLYAIWQAADSPQS